MPVNVRVQQANLVLGYERTPNGHYFRVVDDERVSGHYAYTFGNQSTLKVACEQICVRNKYSHTGINIRPLNEAAQKEINNEGGESTNGSAPQLKFEGIIVKLFTEILRNT